LSSCQPFIIYHLITKMMHDMNVRIDESLLYRLMKKKEGIITTYNQYE
jgi:hypothetical protein